MPGITSVPDDAFANVAQLRNLTLSRLGPSVVFPANLFQSLTNLVGLDTSYYEFVSNPSYYGLTTQTTIRYMP
jgi:hypothetical protein